MMTAVPTRQLGHSFDPGTYFCLKCGVAMESFMDLGTVCREGVVPISHIRAQKRMDELVGKVMDQMSRRT